MLYLHKSNQIGEYCNYDTNSEPQNSKHKLVNYNLLPFYKIREQMSYLFSKKNLIIPESFFSFSLFALFTLLCLFSLPWLADRACLSLCSQTSFMPEAELS